MDNWKRVQELFLAAADLPPEEQTRFLNSRCDGDPELRAEVEEMLVADLGGVEALSTAVKDEAALFIDSPALAGERLGAYRVMREVGRGGMGVVYLATRDDDQFHKQVAIKVVKLGMDTAEVLGRFRHERQILANLDHPGIARLLDGGTTPAGRPYFVMEYVEGQTIDVFCRERELDVNARCRLFLLVLDAVAHAHRSLVVHRDLKPANIFVTKEGAPKLLDFGIAKLLTADSGSAFTADQAKHPFTPEYASPEQILEQSVTTSADVYSLGAILYELLTDRRALRNVEADGSLIAPRQWQPSLDGDLENIVLKAMRNEAERRYASVDQLAEDVKRYLAGWPVSAQPDSLGYRLRKFVRRRAYSLAAAGLIVASLTAGMILAMTQAHRAKVETERARQRLTEMIDLSNLSLSEVYAERVSGSIEDRERFLRSSGQLLDKLRGEAPGNPRFRMALATAYLRLGELQGDLQGPNRGGMKDALHSLQTGSGLLEPLGQDREATLLWLDLRRLAGKVMLDLGQYQDARAYLLDSRRVAEALSQAHPSDKEALQSQARIEHWISGSYEGVSDFSHAIEVTRRTWATLNALEQRFPDDSELVYDLSITETRLGWERIKLGDPEAAAANYRRATVLRERIVEQNPSNMLYRRGLKLAYEHMAGILGSPLMVNLGRPREARNYIKKARDVSDDPQMRQAQADYAHFLMMASIIDPAPEELDSSLDGLTKSAALYEAFAAASPNVVNYKTQLAYVYLYMGHRLLARGNYPQAVAEYRRALAEAEKILVMIPAADYAVGQAIDAERGIARALALLGNRQGATEAAARLMKRARQGKASPLDVAKAQLTLAEVDQKFGECEQARPAAQAAVAALGIDDPLRRGDPPRRGDPRAEILDLAASVRSACDAMQKITRTSAIVP